MHQKDGFLGGSCVGVHPLSGQEVIDSVLLTDVSDCHYYYFCSRTLCESSRYSVVDPLM